MTEKRYEPLFQPFERRPAGCQAVVVTYDNIDRIAAYFSGGGYETVTVRARDTVTLGLRRGEEPLVEVKPGMVLVYGHPPQVVANIEEFYLCWRRDLDADTHRSAEVLP